MTTDEKMLLLKDLCARLPYGVKCSFGVDDAVYEITGINPTCCGASEIQATHVKSGINGDFAINACKPYLFPMSSMTEEQRNEFDTQTFTIMFGECICKKNDEMAYGKLMKFDLDFYNKHHLDWIGLIPMGLAIDATGLNIY